MIFTDTICQYRKRPTAGIRFGVIVFLISVVSAGCFGEGTLESASSEMERSETAVLAGGCFWGVEAVFERLHGVLDVASGYSGGRGDTADYHAVSTGATDHAESVQIVYDPELISFEVLLEVFFSIAHDPTQLNYQGPDMGPQYRSAVFYADDEQKRITERYIEKLDAEGLFPKPVVTQVVPLEKFYPAEEYHQDFMQRNPQHPYIVYWDRPKITHLERAYPELLAER